MIPAGFIQDLLSRVDIVELIGRHVTLKKAGANYMGLCPFHGEKSPSFSVSASKQFYHCFGCGVSGDAIKFLTEHTGATFREAVGDLAGQIGMQVPDEDDTPEARAEAAQRKQKALTLGDVMAKANASYREQLKRNDRAINYLKSRGLTGVVAGHFGLGFAPDGWRHLSTVFPRYDDPALVEAGLVITNSGDQDGDEKRYDRFRDRIMFPIRDLSGDVIAFGGRVLGAGEPKYLNSPETPLFVKGRELYGLFEARRAIRDRGHALVVEGYMDVVALAQLGLGHAVATLGTACTDEHVRKLLRFTDTIVFSFDGDAAGRRAAVRALEASLPHATDLRSFKFLFLPPEHDPDSFVRELGVEAFEARVAASVPLSRQIIDTASEGCDLSQVEGRARMLAQARPLWAALPEGALRAQLLRELAESGQLPLDELSRLWRVGATQGSAQANRGDADHARGREDFGRDNGAPRYRQDRPATRPTARRPALVARRPVDHIARALLQRSEWWDVLSEPERETLSRIDGWHGELFRWLERTLQDHGPTPWAALRMGLADEPWAHEAHRLVDDMPAAHEVLLDDLHRAIAQLHHGEPFKPPTPLPNSRST